MKIAVSYNTDNNTINGFLSTSHFLVFQTNYNSIVSSEVVSTMKGDIDLTIGMLGLFETDAVICNEIDQEAVQLLEDEGIVFYSGITGNPDQAVSRLLNGTLKALLSTSKGKPSAC